MRSATAVFVRPYLIHRSDAISRVLVSTKVSHASCPCDLDIMPKPFPGGKDSMTPDNVDHHLKITHDLLYSFLHPRDSGWY